MFIPKIDVRPRPAVVVLGGSEGGRPEAPAALLASHGYVSVALAYFGESSLPRRLESIPIEYAVSALEAVRRHPAVDGSRVGILAYSRGAELALLTACQSPVSAIAAVVGSPVVHCGVDEDNRTASSELASWTSIGRPLPYVGVSAGDVAIRGASAELRPAFERGLDEAEVTMRAEIPVERINAPMLLVSAKGDQLWPSQTLAEVAVRRLAVHGRGATIRHLCMPGAGHGLPLPHLPATTTAVRHSERGLVFSLGGTAPANARASRIVWHEMLGFFGVHLGMDFDISARGVSRAGASGEW
jgi:dienelactone hydrolase